MASHADATRPTSTWWLVVSVVIWALGAASMVAAIVYQSSASQPIGESEVFTGDAAEATSIIDDAGSVEDAVRHARNQLDIEAVSLVDGDGMVTSSTSGSLSGITLTNPLLSYGVSNQRFAGLAAPVAEPIEIDGVVEWPFRSVLYQVLSPLEGGDGFVLLHYDIEQLLGRRAQPGEIQSETMELLALGGVFVILGAVVFVGHTRAMRRQREMAVESDLLRKHSEELEAANVKLAEARRRAEQALDLAEEKMRIRSEFVLMINHELRTPLTSVVTGAELMRDGTLDANERREVIDSMIANGQRLNEIIDQILAVARIENRGLAYELERIPLEEVCEATEALLPESHMDPTREVRVETDVRTLALVVNSLADNAVTHGASAVAIGCSMQPVIEPMMELGSRPEEAVFFSVSDDGPGIDPDFLPRAFEKFEKNSFSSGTGLGLYMVRMMTDALGGSIAVHSTPDGTTFQIALPARVSDRVMEAV